MSRFHSQIREVINRNLVINLALAQGYNAFVPVYDGGVDFILYREADQALRKVQLKARWTIDKKYLARDIWIAFPAGEHWYLVPHDVLVATAEASAIAASKSWIEEGHYSRPRLPATEIERIAEYRFHSDTITEVTPESANLSSFDDRITWRAGDLVLIDKDGKKTKLQMPMEPPIPAKDSTTGVPPTSRCED